MSKRSPSLAEYRKRRNPAATPEPVPKSPARKRSSSKKRFVIQEHHARALHWDFRLERDGVLVSWAIPKGLPTVRSTNHLAVHTEDHPLEYATFHGEIPKGEYGGGAVSIWDKGSYDELKWSDREVMVILKGRRAKGTYVLFATSGKNWMIHKMDDPPADYEPMPFSVKPMLATPTTDLPPDDEGWDYEFKWDGIRALGYVDGGRIRLESRNGNELTSSFPELRRLGEALGSRQVILDGEIVIFDEEGRPRFQLLQPRIHAADGARAKRLSASNPVTYVIFELLYLDGRSLLDEPYQERRRVLESLGLEHGANWAISPRFPGPGADLLRASREQQLEGIIAKRRDSPYRAGRRSSEWLKVKNFATQEVVVGGWTPGKGRRGDSIGSLLVGIPENGSLRYVGQVGTGFSDEMLEDMAKRLRRLAESQSPFSDEIPPRYRRDAHFVKPRLVGEVSFGEWTKDGRLRQPSWRGLRPDKRPQEVVRES